MNKLLRAAGTDPAAERNGIERTFSVDGAEVFRVTLRRNGAVNPAFMKKQEELLKPFRDAGITNLNMIDPDKQREITRELYAATVVVTWNADDFGEPFSVEACKRTMEGSTDFQDWIVNQSSSAAEFRRKQTEQNAGN